MITRIPSTTHVSGSLYKNKIMLDVIKNVIQYLDGYKDVKLYLDESNIYLPIVNIVIMMKKDYELMDAIDGSLNKAADRLEDEFRFSTEKIFMFVIWK